MASSPNDSTNIDEVKEEVKNILAKVVDDVGKTSALRQLMIGGTTGWYLHIFFIFNGYCCVAINTCFPIHYYI